MKLSQTHKAHLPTHLVQDIESGEEDLYSRVRMVRGVVKLDDGDSDSDYATYYYRGFRFEHNSSNTYNPWEIVLGRSSVDGRSVKGAFETLAEVKALVDSRFYGPVQQKG